jgi:hypothetical protein
MPMANFASRRCRTGPTTPASAKGGGREPNLRGIASRDRSAGPHHAQHPAFEWWARFRRREHLSFQAGLEAVDEDARRPEAGQFYDCRGSEFDHRSERHPLEVETGSGDVFAKLSWSNREATRREGCEELGWDQVNLPQIGKPRLATSEIAVPNERASVGVAFDAMALHHQDPIP